MYDDFELMLQRSGPYGGRLQSDTLRDLEGTLALAHEMNSMSRYLSKSLTSFGFYLDKINHFTSTIVSFLCKIKFSRGFRFSLNISKIEYFKKINT